MNTYPNSPINICPKLISSKVYRSPSDVECAFCWQPKTVYPRQKVELLNSKYCRLYTNYNKTFKGIIPNFEICKPLYTKCDYQLEKKNHDYIITLEDLFKKHQELVKEELDKQKCFLNEMWLQSQRFLLLTLSIACVKPYPEIVSIPTEQEALKSFHCNLKQINESNCLLSASLKNIETTRNELHRQCEQLDKTVESPFINGAYYIKPLSYVLEILNDLFHHFYSSLYRQHCWAQLLVPEDSVSDEDYMNLLKSKKDNDLMENLSRCKCLRSQQNNCNKDHKTC